MIILYTDKEGGQWIPFNTPLKPYDIFLMVEVGATGLRDFPAIFADPDCDRLYPDGDTLPRFHSILLSDGQRWDAHNQRWHTFQTGPQFREWWDKYVAHYLELPEDQNWWRDQGHPSTEDIERWSDR